MIKSQGPFNAQGMSTVEIGGSERISQAFFNHSSSMLDAFTEMSLAHEGEPNKGFKMTQK